MELSAGALHDILSPARSGDIQGSSGLAGVSDPSVSLEVTSPSVSRIVPDVRPSHPFSSNPGIPVAPRFLVSSSSVPPSTPLSDFPL